MGLEKKKQQNDKLVAPTSYYNRCCAAKDHLHMAKQRLKLEETKHDQAKESYEWCSIFCVKKKTVESVHFLPRLSGNSFHEISRNQCPCR